MNPAAMAPDITFFIQMGLFFISYALLHYFFFTPYLNLLEARRLKTSGLKEQSVLDKEKAEKYRADYENFMKNERRRVVAWSDEEKKKVADHERQVISAARDKVAGELKVSRDVVQAEVDKARKDLAPLAAEYSSQIASKILGRKVNVSAVTSATGKRASAETSV